MKKENVNFLNKIAHTIISLFIILFITIVIARCFTKDNKEIKDISINEGWKVETFGKVTNDVDILTYNGSIYDENETVLLSYKFKEDYNIIFPTIFLKTDNYLREASIDNKKIDIGINKNKKIIQQYYSINIPNDYKGKTLELKIDIKQSESNKLIKSLKLMSENDYAIYQLRLNKVTFLLALAMCILGLLIILMVLVIPIKTQKLKKLFWTGFTFFNASVAMIANCGMLELVVNSNRMIKNIIFTGTFFCIPGVLMIAYNTFKNEKYKKMMYDYNIALYVIYCLIRMANNVNIISYRNSLRIMEMLMFITAILLLIYNLASFKKVSIMEKIYTIGMSMCYAQCIAMLIICSIDSTFVGSRHWNTYIIIIVFSFFLVTIIYYAYVVDGYLNRVTEKRILSTLAYTDPLTGIMNRTKYEEILDKINNKDSENVTVLSFDLNNLKKFNDKYGHEAGDIYIKNFAESLKKVFETIGFVGRIGGDEFVVLIENKSIDIASYIKKLNSNFVESMQDCNMEYEASFSHGYANSKDENMTIKDLINLADKRMYDCKKQQKVSRE